MDRLRRYYSSTRSNSRGHYREISPSTLPDTNLYPSQTLRITPAGPRRRWVPIAFIIIASVLVAFSLSKSHATKGNADLVRVYGWKSLWSGNTRNTSEAGWIRYQAWDLQQSAYDDLDGANMQIEDPRRRDGDCVGWTAERAVSGTNANEDDRRSGRCWRDGPVKQLHAVLKSRPDLFSNEDAYRALEYLYECYADMSKQCSPNTFRVLLGNYLFYKMSFRDHPFPPGEIVWQRSQVRAFQELEFTLLSAHGYAQMVDAHRMMPDVITIIWSEDIDHMTCQSDPRCIKDMLPTLELNSEFQMFRGQPAWQEESQRPDLVPHKPDQPGQKWMWTRDELDRIPHHERGTIPLHKLFVPTVWGSFPGQAGFRIPTTGDFSYNSLGSQWTVASFAYPNHTYLPFGIESTCKRIPTVPFEEKEDRAFVLAKLTNLYHAFEAPPPASWPDIASQSGLEIICSSANPENHDLPQGLNDIGHLDPVGFATALSKSKVMIGIGHPIVSPSPYVALCQGTPVLMPYYQDTPPADAWGRLSSHYSQHGPLLEQLGPPYVYPYRGANTTDLIRQLKRAIETPIERFILPEQQWTAIKERLEWYMWFDWERLAQAVSREQSNPKTMSHLMITSRCFESGKCVPYDHRRR